MDSALLSFLSYATILDGHWRITMYTRSIVALATMDGHFYGYGLFVFELRLR
jgi:hypothetical protein